MLNFVLWALLIMCVIQPACFFVLMGIGRGVVSVLEGIGRVADWFKASGEKRKQEVK